MYIDDKFNKIVDAASWKKQLNISFSTNRYNIKAESIAYLPKQTAIVAKHDHMMYQLRYFPAGIGIDGIEDEEFSIKSGTFMIISPFVPHYQIHSDSAYAEEYTMFLEISPAKTHRLSENEIIYKNFDCILDIIVNKPYFFGNDFNSAGEEIEKLISHLLINKLEKTTEKFLSLQHLNS